jgi:phosphatidylglycerol---prolipoprotein diacylglyceryl transferase
VKPAARSDPIGGNLSRVNLASIPSPSTSVWHLGFLPLRAYAVCIVLGIIAAGYITERRMRARGAAPYAILDISVWAVPCGIIGARIYHVITSPQLYFGKGGNPVGVFYIWQGGLGIWGAVAGGAFGAWIAARRLGIPLSFVADALAPGLPVAQAIGRFGNYFNNELYGRHTSLPWGLRVHAEMVDGKAVPVEGQLFLPGLYHPTFLYEVIWDLGVALLVYLLDRKFKFGRGRAFALYVMAYTAGRAWIEYLRIDTANHFLGLRINDWVSLVVFIGALIYFVRVKGPQLILTPTSDEAAPGAAGAEPVEAEPAADAVDGDESERAADASDHPTTDSGPPGARGAPDSDGAVQSSRHPGDEPDGGAGTDNRSGNGDAAPSTSATKQ